MASWLFWLAFGLVFLFLERASTLGLSALLPFFSRARHEPSGRAGGGDTETFSPETGAPGAAAARHLDRAA